MTSSANTSELAAPPTLVTILGGCGTLGNNPSQFLLTTKAGIKYSISSGAITHSSPSLDVGLDF